jgi:glucose/mannose-6-phosphate isomerase
MADLNNAGSYSLLDPSGLRHRIRDLPRHCEQAWQRAQSFDLPWIGEAIDQVVIGGMGGSAIAGDLVVDFASQQLGSPITVVRGFDLPVALNERSLAVLCSYSGNTEETLSLFRQARQTGTRVLVVAGGGQLREEALAQGLPVLEINAPGEPRSAVGYNLMLLLGALDRLGVVATPEQEVQQAVSALDRQNSKLGEEVPARDNPAKQLATELLGKMVVVASGGFFTGVGRRWKSQFNENAKVWAFFEELPELLHNTVEAIGAKGGGGCGADNLAVLLLQPKAANPDLLERYAVAASLLKNSGFAFRTLEATDDSPLGQSLAMISLGDWVSYYLAHLRDIDPSATPAIELGKETLALLRKGA